MIETTADLYPCGKRSIYRYHRTYHGPASLEVVAGSTGKTGDGTGVTYLYFGSEAIRGIAVNEGEVEFHLYGDHDIDQMIKGLRFAAQVLEDELKGENE